MRRSSRELPKDPNQLAYEIVKVSTEKDEEAKEKSAVSEYLARIGRKGGIKGGRARAKRLTAEQRVSIARNAAKTRWKKPRKSDSP